MPESGIPIQDPKKLSQGDLVVLLQKATADLQDCRRTAERRLHESETKGRLDLDRLRATTAAHSKDLESQNSALVKSLARLQAEVDSLKSDNAVLSARVKAFEDAKPAKETGPMVIPLKGIP